MSSDNPPKPVIDWAAIRHNAFTENPGGDWIALDTNLMPIGRASDLGAVMKGCPGAHAYVQQPKATPTVEAVKTVVMPFEQIAAAEAAENAADTPVRDPDGNEPDNEIAPASIEPTEPVTPASGAAAFDHDGDGKVGGTRPRNRNSRKAAQGE